MVPGARSDLLDRAGRAGVLCEYVDVDGKTVAAQPDSVEAVLDALDNHDLEPLTIQPVVVAWGGSLTAIGRNGARNNSARFTIETEAGETIEGEAIGSGTWWRFGIEIPLGYHRLRLAGTTGESTLVIAAPRKAHQPAGKQWGVFAPVYALRRDDDRGIGDLSHLRELISWAGGQGAGIVGTLPLLPTFVEPGRNPSPYSPVSLLFWNEIYLDPTSAPFSPDAAADQPTGGPSRTVDYQLAQHQTRALVDRILGDRRIDAWAALHPHAIDYSRFRAYGEQHGQQWRTWAVPACGGAVTNEMVDAGRARWQLAAQWAIDLQMRSLASSARSDGVMIGLDYPVGVHVDGYDIWANRELFVNAVSIGAPPDTFFSGGQNWELVPIHPEVSRRTGHRYLIEGLRHQIALGGLLRIDHIMGLFRRWWIPQGAGATQGAYVTYPAEELLAIIALESFRASAVVVGENLGTVPAGVNQTLFEHGIAGMFIAQDHLDESGGLAASPPKGSMALVNTHDMASFAETWDGRPDPHSGLRSLITELRSSPADLVIVSLEDLWLERGRQNLPGSTVGNWQQRMMATLAQLSEFADL